HDEKALVEPAQPPQPLTIEPLSLPSPLSSTRSIEGKKKRRHSQSPGSRKRSFQLSGLVMSPSLKSASSGRDLGGFLKKNGTEIERAGGGQNRAGGDSRIRLIEDSSSDEEGEDESGNEISKDGTEETDTDRQNPENNERTNTNGVEHRQLNVQPGSTSSV